MFWKYLLLVVAVERAAAVFVGMTHHQNRVDWSLRINRIKEVLQKDNPPTAVLKQVHVREKQLIDRLKQENIIVEFDDVPEPPADADYVGYLTAAKQVYEFHRARLDSVSSGYVAVTVFVVGIILATLGLSLFGDLLDGLPEPGSWQASLVRFADIFVTGGLLGGGSAGLNAMVAKVNEFLNRA